jgi:hypothetical protein
MHLIPTKGLALASLTTVTGLCLTSLFVVVMEKLTAMSVRLIKLAQVLHMQASVRMQRDWLTFQKLRASKINALIRMEYVVTW